MLLTKHGRFANSREFAMQKVQAVFRNGRVELGEPVSWPEGATLDVVPNTSPEVSRSVRAGCDAADLLNALRNPEPGRWGCDESQWPQTPEEIEAWLDWFDSREPVFAPDEQAAFDAELAASKQLQKSLTQAAWDPQENGT